MDADIINQAVKDCVRESIGKHDPIATLLAELDKLQAEGWPMHQIEMVRTTSLRMLSAIYNVSGAEADE